MHFVLGNLLGEQFAIRYFLAESFCDVHEVSRLNSFQFTYFHYIAHKYLDFLFNDISVCPANSVRQNLECVCEKGYEKNGTECIKGIQRMIFDNWPIFYLHS